MPSQLALTEVGHELVLWMTCSSEPRRRGSTALPMELQPYPHCVGHRRLHAVHASMLPYIYAAALSTTMPRPVGVPRRRRSLHI